MQMINVSLQGGRKGRVYNIQQLLAMPEVAEDDHWLVRNMLPRVGKVMAYGEGGAHKTTMMFDLAVAVSSGGRFVRRFPILRHGPSLVVSTESTKEKLRARLTAFLRGREMPSMELDERPYARLPLPTVDKIPIFVSGDAMYLDRLSDLEVLCDHMEEVRGQTGEYPAMVLLDPLDSFVEGDENSAKETKNFRRYLDEFVKYYRVTLVVIHHASKGETVRIRGSSAWKGWADTSLRFVNREEQFGNDEIRILNVHCDKQRDGPMGPLMTVVPEFINELKMTTVRVLNELSSLEEAGRSKVQERVIGELKQGPKTTNALVRDTSYTRKRIEDALMELEAAQRVERVNDIAVPTGTGHRYVPGWRYVHKISIIDASSAILRTEEAMRIRPEREYFISEAEDPHVAPDAAYVAPPPPPLPPGQKN